MHSLGNSWIVQQSNLRREWLQFMIKKHPNIHYNLLLCLASYDWVKSLQVLPVHILLGLLAWDSWRLKEFLGPSSNIESARLAAKELITDERELEAARIAREAGEEIVPLPSCQTLPFLLLPKDIPFGSEASKIFKGIAEVSMWHVSLLISLAELGTEKLLCR